MDRTRFNIIKNALKNFQELLEKPCILVVGRTTVHTQALIDNICKNYKEVKVTNLDDEKKLKAFEIIKEHSIDVGSLCNYADYEEYCEEFGKPNEGIGTVQALTKDEFDLLKEVGL